MRTLRTAIILSAWISKSMEKEKESTSPRPVENVFPPSSNGNKMDCTSDGALSTSSKTTQSPFWTAWKTQKKKCTEELKWQAYIKSRMNISWNDDKTHLCKWTRLPSELTRTFSTYITSNQHLAVNLVIHVDRENWGKEKKKETGKKREKRILTWEYRCNHLRRTCEGRMVSKNILYIQ